jgi:uncharacterized pyridoxamine 5'-phosphate oxidase family protein
MMTIAETTAELDERFSSPGASAVPWSEARRRLGEAEIYWISTVHPEGRPNVAPLIAVWLEETLYFCTGEHERKAKNLARNPSVAVTTGCNLLGEGMDLVLEGEAVMVREADQSRVLVFAVNPTTAFGSVGAKGSARLAGAFRSGPRLRGRNEPAVTVRFEEGERRRAPARTAAAAKPRMATSLRDGRTDIALSPDRGEPDRLTGVHHPSDVVVGLGADRNELLDHPAPKHALLEIGIAVQPDQDVANLIVEHRG